jgi:epoxyqueuosine reductase
VPGRGEIEALGRAAGLAAVGVAPAAPFLTTRRHLERRKAAGLHAGMSFTYRRPERSTDPGTALPGAQALVVGAWAYRRTAPEPPPASPDSPDVQGAHAVPSPGATGAAPAGTVARYAWEDHYGALRAALQEVAAALRAEGWRARVLVDDNALHDREAAYRAGLGWYGKNANLLLPGAGSWFVLGSVVTDAPLDATTPADRVADGCGTCTRCLPACPTGAIVAPGVVDARRCLAWLLQAEGPFPPEHRVALGGRIYGCDDCQEVCPPNRRAERHDPDPVAAGVGAEPTVDLLAMLAASDEELLARHGRWYVPRRQPRYLRRNALVALGNVADAADPAVAQALRRALAETDAIVRSHAVWAAHRLGRPDLLAAVVDDRDPLVRAELAAPVAVRPTSPPAAVPAPVGRVDGGRPTVIADGGRR